MIGQRVINNILGHKPKADNKSRNRKQFYVYVLDTYESLSNDVYDDYGPFSTAQAARNYAEKNHADEDYRIVEE